MEILMFRVSSLISLGCVPRPAVRDDLRALEGYHSAQVEVRVRLNTNESPYPPPVAWHDALRSASASLSWERYPDRSAAELRRAIGAMHGVGADQIFVANGSNEVLQTVLLTFAGSGRSVATFEPTYQLHGHLARLSGATVVEGERSVDFALDLAEVDRVLSVAHPAVTFLCSPNNPTGREEPIEHLHHLLARAPGLVVVDEAYGQFASWSAIPMIADDVPLVVTRTFSKTWSMAAARLGYLIGPAWLVGELDKVVLPYHLDSFKQLAGRLALDYIADMEDRVALIVAERERISAAFGDLPVDFWPSGANYVLFRPQERPGREVWNDLVARSVLVRDCTSWPRLAGCLRVTVGTRDENDVFLAALGEVLT
jgi:histidinol-phosphate aminotransferase